MRPFFNSRLAALAGLFAGLCLVYNVLTPLYEAPDEGDHVEYAAWLADGRGLPHLVDDRGEVGEIWQPPLYYALIAAVIAPLDRAGLDTIAPLSDDWRAGLSRLAHYHTTAESFPFRGPALTVHVARLASTALGLITVLAAYGIARHLIPRHALAAAALVALNPQFIFMSAAVNNDNLVIVLCSVALWILAKLITDPPAARRAEALWFVLLGLVWGLAGLAKLTGLTLGLPIGLTLLYLGRRERSWRPLLLGGLLSGGVMLLVCGWWFWRNWQLYGDPLAWDEMLAVTGVLVRPELLPWPDTLRYAAFLRQSFWAVFGYGVTAPDSFYWTVTIIMALALLGLAVQLSRARARAITPRRFAFLILAIWSLTVFVFLLRWMRVIDATNQGRLLFPAIAALGVLAAAGLAALEGRRRWLSTAAVAVLGMWAAALPLLVLVPAYAQPAPVEPVVIATPTDALFGDAIRLRGYDLPPAAEPGRPLRVTLYWQAERPIDDSYVVALRILDPVGQPATGLDTLPAGGRYSTVVWEPGRLFADTIELPPVSAGFVPGRGELLVILYPRGEPGAPLPVSAGGAAAGHEVRLGVIKLVPASVLNFDPSLPLGAHFDNRFRLLGYEIPQTSVSPGRPLTISLFWEALSPDGRDYTVFVHLLNEAGELVAQSDGPPGGGTYPTSIWSGGEQIPDERTILPPLGTPPGSYTLLVGLYDPATGARLPAYGPDDERYVNDAVELTPIQVVPLVQD